MKKILLLLLIPAQLYCQHSILLPEKQDREIIIEHSAFTMSYNTNYVLPSWVAYTLTKEQVLGTLTFKPKYVPDPKIVGRKADKKDYKGSSYIMGQLVLVDDMKHSEQAMEESYYMSNIVPQKLAFYKYMWKTLTDFTHKWVMEGNQLYIVAGPILSDAPFGTIGENKVSLAKRYYKVILDLESKKAIGFIFNNGMSSQSITNFALSVDEVEKITGIDFFPELEDEIENFVESSLDISKWNFEQ
ncbi:MAG: DNA/RNA non-specific endonuclease [Bacteroidales bacterium]|nr:DNA/RNA non-specific endonuclease [Bacteroidales bacterium]